MSRRPEVGQWYVRRDTRDVFQVTGLDERSQTVEIQTSDGDLDEIEMETWRTVPLAFAEPPEDWSGPIDVQADDLDYPQSEIASADGSSPLDPLEAPKEAWEDTAAEEEIDSHTERVDPEQFS
jgi:hypothetical protein